MTVTAVLGVATSRLVSRNHSTAGSPVGGASPGHGPPTASPGSAAPPVVGGRRSWRWRTSRPRRAAGARRAALLAARLAPLAHAVDLDLDVPVAAPARRVSNSFGRPWRDGGHAGRARAPPAVQAALRVEQLEEISLPIHDADHPRLAAQGRRRLLDVAQTVEPALHLVAGLVWQQRRTGRRVLRRLLLDRRRIETRSAAPPAAAPPIDRQGQMQMQAERLRCRSGCAR